RPNSPKSRDSRAPLAARSWYRRAGDGGVIARGTAELPIVFTASAATPVPGFYASAVRFIKPTKVNSAFAYCRVSYGEIAFDIHYGTPEITHCHIADNAQSGIYCRNDAAPSISFNTLTGNRGEGAITCVGNARPRINNNNITGNDFAIQARSTIYIDARQNWWGKAPPDLGMIIGDLETNVNIKPWLEAPEAKAFRWEGGR
ncbi:MAG: right-handed parallel beta-helix repeat-containing protein, partial [Syntrophales bacterium]|nr:right-handed parallel beta-helix repeat-containing protein [Syntrophales bacterium]